MNLVQILARIDMKLAETGMSATALSLKAGLSSDGIRNMRRTAKKSGNDDVQSGANMSSLQKIANALDVSISWLLTGQENDEPGFSEDAAPWTGANREDGSLEAMFRPKARNPAVTHRATTDMPRFGILQGDLLVCDLARDPAPGELAVLTVIDQENDSNRTIIRLYAPPFLISGDMGAEQNIERCDNNTVIPRYPIIGSIRGA